MKLWNINKHHIGMGFMFIYITSGEIVVDVAIPADINIVAKEQEKVMSCNLAREIMKY